MIWDVHCHLHGIAGDTPSERLTELLKYADRMQIERLCVFMGMNWSYDPTPEQMRQQNDDVMAAIEKRPERAFGFVYLSPNHVEASLAELDRCVRNGPMVGVKLWVARHCNTPELDPLVQHAAELKAPILQHTYLKVGGNLRGESTPMELAELARRHPTVPLICGHTGADWEVGIRAI
ncbi:MAG TPA: amidohydrolase family protein, partial [Candidatus Dormibacteraeota bacterium]|nr:amidohydrolase family protein [Candidatus Dormibacteraeota bacterium]